MRMLDERIAALPPSARAKLEFNLGEMRRAADEIAPDLSLIKGGGGALLREKIVAAASARPRARPSA